MKPPRASILAVGSVAFDTIRTPTGSAGRILGGSAVHFSLAARFFTSVKIVGVVGTDFPLALRERLKAAGVNTEGLVTRKGKTFLWKGVYREDLNHAHTLKTELNVFSAFNPVLSASDRHAGHLFLGNIDPRLQLGVLKQMNRPRWTACDTMDYWIRQSRESLLRVLKRIDISFMNDGEAKALSEKHNLLKAARWVQRHGPPIVVIKKGEHGVLCLWEGRVILYPAYLLDEVIDPTGAGDTFAGGFLGYLARFKKTTAKRIKNALAYGTILASFNVEDFGTRRVLGLDPKAIGSRFKLYKKMVSFE